jgi:ferric-dicitrate binding protein FerR (iron transport regulator)
MGIRRDSLMSWGGRALAACVIALALGVPCRDALAQDPTSSCTPAIGRLVSLQGSVELQRAGGKDWEAVKRLDTSICAGDRLRTGALSRALLFVQPETIVRVDQNTAITLHQTDEVIEVEFFAAELAAQATGSPSRGAGYFITRFPKKFKVVTPHMNAAVEGTEFMVELSSDATKLTVIEGKVSSESVATRDTQMVTAGQSIASGAAGPGAIVAVIKPQDAVQWVLRYPPLSDGPSTSTHAEGAAGRECG